MKRTTKISFSCFAKKGVASAAALAMTATMFVAAPSAMAAQSPNTVTAAQAVTATASPASQTSCYMLGISTVEEATYKNAAAGTQSPWGNGLKYTLFGSDTYGESTDPYVANTISGDSPSKTFGNNRDTSKGASRPTSMMAEYGGSNTAANNTWKLLPDILIGNFVDKAGTTTNFKDSNNNSVNLITGKATKEGVEPIAGAENYDPKVSEYNPSSMAKIIDSTYDIGIAAKSVVENSKGTKILRYGDSNSAFEIAQDYEEFIKGIQGYVLYQLDINKASKKSVAFISSMEETGTGTVFKLMNPGDSSTSAAEDRAIEAMKNVCDVYTGTDSQATAADLAKVDLIVIQQSVASDTQLSIVEKLGSLKSKTYYISSTATSGQGTIYDVTRNNTEVGQNYARLIGCAYPEYISQADCIAYWYKNFLHVKSSKLAEVIDNAMDGIRNWDSATSGNDYTSWTTETVKNYNESKLLDKIQTGCAYLETWSDSQFEGNNGWYQLLKPTSYMGKYSLVKTVKAPKVSKLKAAKKSFTVTVSKVSGAKYQVSYSTSKKFTKSTTKTKSFKSTKLTVKSLKASKKYYVKARASKVINGKTVYSKWSAVKTVKTK